MTHGQQPKKDSEKIVVKHMQFTVTEDDVEPPPPNLTSKFKTLQDWLVNICINDKPKKSIAKYNFGLFESESPHTYTVVLTGVNTYDEEKNDSRIRIEFTPKEMYFALPKTYYENLNREQLLKKLISQLKSFSDTKEFKTSFFTQANVIVFDTTGQIIWSK
ncbi:hypothetical protein EON73_02875 [bacterium]|nr:MAG: hypothetical protein EON73_02875 [bacterium]